MKCKTLLLPRLEKEWLLYGILLMFLLPFPGMGCPIQSDLEAQEGGDKEQSIQERWGIEILGIRLTAAGKMLDFRYRVIDPEKASSLLSRQSNSYLVDQMTGTKLIVPRTRLGPMRQTAVKPLANRQYFIFFTNRDGLVKPGSKVTVVIGDFKGENLIVQ